MDVLKQVFLGDFMPHGMCYMWKPGLLWLHVSSDALIFLAYTSIPFTLLYILKRRQDLVFSKVMALFVAFVLLCGFTHAIAIWNVWNGAYWFSGTVKSITAVVSVATAIALYKLIPALDAIPTIHDLQHQIKLRKNKEKQLNEQQFLLQRYSDELSRSNQELDHFAYVASHDLKSPLRGIRQLVSFIKEDMEEAKIDLPDHIGQHMKQVDTRINRMNKLLDDLLAYSRADNIEGDIEKVDCNHLTQTLFELVNSKPNLKLVLSEPLPTLTTLKTPLTTVFRNLFDNAIKHHDKDQGVIGVKVEEQDNYYLFTVSDDGPGVASDYHETMMTLFKTLKPRDQVEGSGMGLAMIKKIINRFGGSIKIESDVGKGMSFSFQWPKETILQQQFALKTSQ